MEHLHFPVPEDSSDYTISVELVPEAGNTTQSKYAVAWWGAAN